MILNIKIGVGYLEPKKKPIRPCAMKRARGLFIDFFLEKALVMENKRPEP
jgi:hypothetical protein